MQSTENVQLSKHRCSPLFKHSCLNYLYNHCKWVKTWLNWSKFQSCQPKSYTQPMINKTDMMNLSKLNICSWLFYVHKDQKETYEVMMFLRSSRLPFQEPAIMMITTASVQHTPVCELCSSTNHLSCNKSNRKTSRRTCLLFTLVSTWWHFKGTRLNQGCSR